MKNKDMIRKVFQTFTIILFIFQFQQSVRKYFQYPVVEQKSRIPVKDLPNPVVYVCHESQFKYTEALENGYKTFNRFAAGQMENSTHISWKGKWGNTTYKGLENMLFDYDYTSIESRTLSSSTNLWNFNEKKERFLFPHGVCLKIETPQQHTEIEITSKDNINIYFVDPARANNIRTEETPDAKATLGPTSSSFFSFKIYQVEYLLYDESIHDGTSCTDYNKLDMSYGECLNDILMHEFLATYGCLPSWVSTNNSKICEDEISIELNTIIETNLYESINKLVKHLEPDMFKKCLSPCTSMKIKLQEVAYRSNWPGNSFFEATSKDWVTVYTQVYSYDILSLTVDLGSALGLWLGLSCLSILDNILENWISMKSYWKK